MVGEVSIVHPNDHLGQRIDDGEGWWVKCPSCTPMTISVKGLMMVKGGG